MGQYLKDPHIKAKEQELKDCDKKINYYKKEIETMRRQLEESYNIQKITQLEDEQEHKKKILEEYQKENKFLFSI